MPRAARSASSRTNRMTDSRRGVPRRRTPTSAATQHIPASAHDHLPRGAPDRLVGLRRGPRRRTASRSTATACSGDERQRPEHARGGAARDPRPHRRGARRSTSSGPRATRSRTCSSSCSSASARSPRSPARCSARRSGTPSGAPRCTSADGQIARTELLRASCVSST